MKKWIILAIVLAGSAWGVMQWRSSLARNGETDLAARPTTAEIDTRSIRFSVSAAGDIGPAEQVSVRPEVNGRISKLPVDIGDLVKEGEMLFTLDDKDLQIEKESQEKAIERARLELEQGERNYRRSQQLFADKLISEELYEDTRTQRDLARNTLERAQKSLALIDDRLRKTRITAPFDCTILTRPVSVGQAVSGSGGFNSGTEVLTIANLNDLVINAHINQADVTRLKVTQEVEVSVEAVPGLVVTGKVERVAPQATIKNNIKGFAARIELKNADRRIRPGMTANIKIPVASADNVVAVPLAAVFTELNPESQQMERFAFVKQNDGWERRDIEIGVSDNFHAEVLSGLKPGEVVALELSKEELAKLVKARSNENAPGLAGQRAPGGPRPSGATITPRPSGNATPRPRGT